MQHQLNLRIVLEKPTAGVDIGLQKGRGSNYETVQTQQSKKEDLRFEFNIEVKEGKDGLPNFLGPFAQGPPQGRFVYLDIGTYAGQTGTPWSRRLKIPLRGITWKLIEQVSRSPQVLEARVQGAGKDGSPSCGTAKPFTGWKPTQAR